MGQRRKRRGSILVKRLRKEVFYGEEVDGTASRQHVNSIRELGITAVE